MDFHSLTRKELQTLCKKNKIPANITNVAMADALAALPQVEGLDEFLNPREDETGTPDIHHRTAGRTTTQRKAVKEPESRRRARAGIAEEGVVEQENKDANVPLTPAMLPSSRRRATAVSTRRKKEPEMLEDDDDGVQEKPKDVLKTPAAAPSNRKRATGRSVCTKTETPGGGTSVQRAYNTRRSVRLLEKSLSKMSLVDTEEDMGLDKIDDVSEELSGVSSQHVEESSETEEKGASLQTVSAVVSENTDELEVSSKENNTDSECQSHGSEVKSVSGTENDAEAEMQGEPQEEGVGKVNYMESEPHDSNLKLEGGSELISEIERSCDSSELENKECVGTKQEGLSVEASEDAFKEVSDQDIAALTVVAPDDASMDDGDADQGVAGSLQSSVNDASVSLEESVECNIDDDNQGTNEGDDDNQEKNNETEPMKMNQGDEDADEKGVASSEGVLELSSSILCSSGEHQEEELEANSEHSEESKAEMEKTEYTSDVTSESSAILAEKDAGSENSGAVEVCIESNADEKESMEVENVTLQLSLLDVAPHKAEDQKDTSKKLEAEAQTEDCAAGEDTEFDTSNAFSCVDQQVSVESAGSSMDSCSSDGLKAVPVCNSNTVIDDDTDVILEDLAIPTQEPYVSAETMTVAAPIHDQKTTDIPVLSDQIKGEESLCSAQSVANEIQTVPKMISDMSNANNRMKENLSTTDEFQNMSMRGLKKMLKNKLDGKSSSDDTNNNVKVVQEVERKRTALQALPQNLMTTGGSSE